MKRPQDALPCSWANMGILSLSQNGPGGIGAVFMETNPAFASSHAAEANAASPTFLSLAGRRGRWRRAQRAIQRLSELDRPLATTQATPSPLTEGEMEAWRRQRICSRPRRVRDGMRVEAVSWLEARGLLLHPSLSQTCQDTGAPSIRSNEQLSDVIMPLLSRRAREKGHPLPPCICRVGWLEQEQGPAPCGQESPQFLAP